MIEKLTSGEFANVWIYGAGKVGTKLWSDLDLFGIKTNGFVVSRHDGTRIPGADIVELDTITCEAKDTLFVIATLKKFHEEIIANLQAKGYDNYIVWDEDCLCELWQLAEYTFEDRRKKADKCCFILAGYKEFLWNNVFNRIERFIPADIDVCIISSGVYHEELSKLAQKNEWSYLATKKNSVTLIQNIAFAIYKDYEWIYKLDEDIFVTEGSFEHLMEGYLEAEAKSGYQVGISAPLIPVNAFCYNIILDKYDKIEEYENNFGKVQIGGNPDYEIEKNPKSAVFMWNEMPQIDEINRNFQESDLYVVCGVKYSIGFILIKHSFWDEMWGFHVSGIADIGADEEEICAKCINKSKAIIVSKHAVVGHFSFGKQTSRMKEYFMEKPERFEIHE